MAQKRIPLVSRAPHETSDGTPDFFSPQVTEARRFFLDLDPAPAEPLAVVCAGREHCAPDYRVQRTAFPYFSLEFVARGKGSVKLANELHDLIPGTLFAYGPTVPHEMASHPGNPLVKYFLDLSGADAVELLQHPAPAPGSIIQTSAPESILRLFEELIDAGLRKSPFQKRICTAIVRHLLLRIAETAIPLGSLGTDAFETYQLCRRHIEMHYRDAVSLPEIARHCDVAPAYVCRLFKRYDHQTPWQYIVHLKMRDAAHRLQQPGTLIKNVARDLGFSDAFQFSRTFRRVFGVSPRQFLRLQRPVPE